MASLSGLFNLQIMTADGVTAAGHRLYTYAPSTTTHQAAYTDPAGTIPHVYTSDGIGGYYIALDSRGELPAPLFLASGGYDIRLTTPAGATVWTRRAYGVADQSSSGTGGTTGDDVLDQLAADDGGTLITVQPSGAVAQTRTLQELVTAQQPAAFAYSTVSAALLSASTSMRLPAGSRAVSSALACTIPVRFDPGAVLSVSAGISVSFTDIQAGAWRLWTLGAAATVTLGGTIPHAIPQWWGADPSATDAVNAAAIDAALNSGRPVRLVPGALRSDAPIDIDTAGMRITGESSALSSLTSSASSGAVIDGDVSDIRYRDLAVTRATITSGSVGIQHAGTATVPADDVRIRGVRVSGHATGVSLTNVSLGRLDDVSVSTCTTGILAAQSGTTTELKLCDIVMRDVTTASTCTTGLSVTGGARVTADGCRFAGSTAGVSVAGGSTVVLRDCSIVAPVVVSGASHVVLDGGMVRGDGLTNPAVQATGSRPVYLRGEWRVTGVPTDDTEPVWTMATANVDGAMVFVESPDLMRLKYSVSNGGTIIFSPREYGFVTVSGFSPSSGDPSDTFTFTVDGLVVGDTVTATAINYPSTSYTATFTFAVTAADTLQVTASSGSVNFTHGVYRIYIRATRERLKS